MAALLDSVCGRGSAQRSTTPLQACDGQHLAAAPKSGVHCSGRIAAGVPNYDRRPRGHLLKLQDKAAPMQRPRLAGGLSFPTTESVQARRNDAVGEEALRGESPGLETPRLPGEERSLQPNRKSPQAPGATPMRATANGQTVPGNVRDRPRASGAGRPGGRKSVLFKKRLATLREGDHARTKKSRARLQMELPQRCRRPACKDKQPKGRADYQHHGGVPGRRDLLYTRKKRKS